VILSAYWVARAKVNDAVGYKRYTDLMPEILAKYDGKVLARGGLFQYMEGSEHFERHVVIEFPTLERAVECYQSPEYQEAMVHRLNGVSVNELVIVEGGEATT